MNGSQSHTGACLPMFCQWSFRIIVRLPALPGLFFHSRTLMAWRIFLLLCSALLCAAFITPHNEVNTARYWLPGGTSSFLSLFLCLLGCVFNYLEFGRSVGVASLMGALDKQEATGSLIRRKYLWRKVSWNVAAIFAVNFQLSFTLSLSLFLSFFSALY